MKNLNNIVVVFFLTFNFLQLFGQEKAVWRDSRWKTVSGRTEVINDAIHELSGLILGGSNGWWLTQNGSNYNVPGILYYQSNKFYSPFVFEWTATAHQYASCFENEDGCFRRIVETKIEKGSNSMVCVSYSKGSGTFFWGVKNKGEVVSGNYACYLEEKVHETWRTYEGLRELCFIMLYKEFIDDFPSFIYLSGWKSGDDFYYTAKNFYGFEKVFDLINEEWLKIEKKIKWEFQPKNTCFAYITIASLPFDRGWYQIDEEKSTLYYEYNNDNPNDPYNIYCPYALNLEEAIQALILHEYAHFLGMKGHGPVNEYVSYQILQLRLLKKGNSYQFRDISKNYLPPCDDNFVEQVSHKMEGQFPSAKHIPPGTMIY